MSTKIAKTCRILYPDCFQAAANVSIDDFCYFSTRVAIGRCSHIATGCSVSGGRDRLFSMGAFASLASGVRIWCVRNDVADDLIGERNDDEQVAGDVILGDHVSIGASCIILPDNSLPEGVAVSALSLVPWGYRFEPWTVYSGNPIRPIRSRNRERVLEQADAFERNMGVIRRSA